MWDAFFRAPNVSQILVGWDAWHGDLARSADHAAICIKNRKGFGTAWVVDDHGEHKRNGPNTFGRSAVADRMNPGSAIRQIEGAMQIRRGFTLVELLVVIAVIGILVALFLPAVQAAREAARRMTCANHLKQFALAVANYSAAHDDRLPPAALAFFGPGGRRPLPKGDWDCDAWSRRQTPSWRIAVLPFLEEQNLYDQFDLSMGVITKPNHPAISQVLPVYQCPSTPGYPRSVLQRGVSQSHNLSVGAWDYGVPVDHILTYENETATAWPPAWNGAKNVLKVWWEDERMGYECPVEIVYGRQARLVWVTDGLSKTTLAYELAWRPNHYDRNGLDGYSSNDGERMSGKMWPVSRGNGWAQIWPTTTQHLYPINRSNVYGLFAFHPGGVNNAMLDGSVRFLEESTDVLVWRAMISRAGGESLGSSE